MILEDAGGGEGADLGVPRGDEEGVGAAGVVEVVHGGGGEECHLLQGG